MKTKLFIILLFPTLIFPGIISGQNVMMQSAEDFVREYFKLFEEMQWDNIPEMYANDAQVVGFGSTILSLPKTMKPVLDRNKTEMTAETIDVKWIQSELTGPNTALVTAKFIDTTNRSGKISVTENISTFLLEHNGSSWKIKKWINNQNYPIIYSDNIDEKYQVGNYPVIYKFTNLIHSEHEFQCCVVEYFKKNGISPAELGNKLGNQFIETWRGDKNFEVLIQAFTDHLMHNTTFVEVLYRTDTTFKAKMPSPPISQDWNITKEDMDVFTENLWAVISNKMGADCSLEEDGQYWIVSLNKR